MQRQLRIIADQRFDLEHFDLMQELIAEEFHAINKSFITNKNYIVKNWAIEAVSGLTIRVNPTTESLLVNSERTGKEKLNYREAGFTTLTRALEPSSTNYVEIEIATETTRNDSVALWDTTANAGAGEEYVQNSDTVTAEAVTLISNTIGWSSQTNRIPLAAVTTNASSITGIVDMRSFLFNLSTDWDFGGTRTDKTIGSIKDNDDAIKTCIKEMKGTANWYDDQGITTLELLERLNYMLVDGGDITWGLPSPAKGSLVAIAADPASGIKDGDTVTISDGTTSVVFEFDMNSAIISGHTRIDLNGVLGGHNATVAQVKAAIIAAINANSFHITAYSPTVPSMDWAENRIELVSDNNGVSGNVAITQDIFNQYVTGASLSHVGMAEGRSVNSLSWNGPLRIMVPGRAFNYTIDAQSVTNIAGDEVVYVVLPTEGATPAGSLTVLKCAAADYVINQTNTRRYIIAFRSDTKMYFGNGWSNVELEDGETSQLGDGIPAAWLTATGLQNEYDADPPYDSNNFVTPSASFTKAISELDAQTEVIWNLVSGKIYDEYVVSDGSSGYQANAYVTLPPRSGVGANMTYQTTFNQLEVTFNGRKARLGADWIESANVGSGVGDRIQLLVTLPNLCEIGFRIQTGGGQQGKVGAALDIYDEGDLISSFCGNINFVGNGVFAEETSDGNVVVHIDTLPNLLVKDEGVLVESSINEIDFVGPAVTATRTATGKIQVEVTGGDNSVWYHGTDSPISPSLGTNFDFYLNEDSGDISSKSTGTWEIVANLLTIEAAKGYTNWVGDMDCGQSNSVYGGCLQLDGGDAYGVFGSQVATFEKAFNATTDWTSNPPYWEFTVLATEHNKGLWPIVQVMEEASSILTLRRIGSDGISILIAPNADVTVRVPTGTPNKRFSGKVYIA